jgi:nucleotide-binding universal stress UspA family protein
MTLDLDLVLVAADNTQDAAEAAEYAAAVADRYDADVHVLHVLDQRIIQGLEAGDIEADNVAGRQQWITAHARESLPADSTTDISQSATHGFSRERLGRTPGSVILDVAENLAADFLVVPRVESEGSPDEVLGKSALHVLEYATQPVLSV